MSTGLAERGYPQTIPKELFIMQMVIILENMKKDNFVLYLFVLIIFNSCNVSGQKTIKTIFENNNSSKIDLASYFDNLKNKFRFLGYQDFKFESYKVISAKDSIIGGTANIIFEDTISKFFYFYFINTKEFHLLIPETCIEGYDNIDNINEINIYNLKGEMKYSFFNYHSEIQNYILESYINNGNSSIFVKTIKFNSKILIDPKNKNYRYILRKKPIESMTINEYCILINEFKNEFKINTDITVSKKNEKSILWYKFYEIPPSLR